MAAGAFPEALVALREAQQPEAAAMFVVACHEIRKAFITDSQSDEESGPSVKEDVPPLPGLNSDNEDVIADRLEFSSYSTGASAAKIIAFFVNSVFLVFRQAECLSAASLFLEFMYV